MNHKELATKAAHRMATSRNKTRTRHTFMYHLREFVRGLPDQRTQDKTPYPADYVLDELRERLRGATGLASNGAGK